MQSFLQNNLFISIAIATVFKYRFMVVLNLEGKKCQLRTFVFFFSITNLMTFVFLLLLLLLFFSIVQYYISVSQKYNSVIDKQCQWSTVKKNEQQREQQQIYSYTHALYHSY